MPGCSKGTVAVDTARLRLSEQFSSSQAKMVDIEMQLY